MKLRAVVLGLVLLPSLALSIVSTSTASSRARSVCVSVQASGLPERAALRTAFLQGFRRPFLLDTLLVERRTGARRWADAGQVANRVRLSTMPCRQTRPDPEGRTWLPVMAGDGPDTDPEVGVAVKLDWRQLQILYVRPKSKALSNDSFPPDRNLLNVWTAVSSPDSARTPLDSMWEYTVVNWAERPSDERRAQEIHGWLVGMAALQAVSRNLGLLPDTLDLVFDSRGRNR